MLNSTLFATTLANGLSVLQCFRSGEAALSNKDLVERTGLSKATISRLTYTLGLKGLLTYDKDLRRYRLGAGVLSLGHPLLAGISLRQVARPFMQDLANYSGGSVSLGVHDRGYMVYIETCRGHDVVAFRPDIGARLPLLFSAMGRAWLTAAPQDLSELAMEEFKKAHPDEHNGYDNVLCGARQDYVAKGYCVSRGDWLGDVHAVATPWPHTVDGELLVFNCGVPTARLSQRSIEEFGIKLVDMVHQVQNAYYGESDDSSTC